MPGLATMIPLFITSRRFEWSVIRSHRFLWSGNSVFSLSRRIPIEPNPSCCLSVSSNFDTISTSLIVYLRALVGSCLTITILETYFGVYVYLNVILRRRTLYSDITIIILTSYLSAARPVDVVGIVLGLSKSHYRYSHYSTQVCLVVHVDIS